MVLILFLAKVEYKESLHKTFDPPPKYSSLSRESKVFWKTMTRDLTFAADVVAGWEENGP